MLALFQYDLKANILYATRSRVYFCQMADVHDKITRSYNMSRIRANNTKPKILIRKFFHAEDFPYRAKQELSICIIA